MSVSSSGHSDNRQTITNKVVESVKSLTELCLERVLEDIDRFNTAFLSTEDACLRKNVLFLQRVYSEYLLKKLTSTRFTDYSKFLDRKYYDFLINEHIKCLNTGIFHRNDWEAAINLISQIGHAVDGVCFHFNTSDDFLQEPCDYLELFAHQVLRFLPNVSSLLMDRSTKCTDETLRIIYLSCKKVKLLQIDSCPITDEGLKALCSSDEDNTLKLVSIILKFVRDCDDGVTFLLKNMPTLKEVAYNNLPNILYNLHANDLRNNSLDSVQKYNLTSLYTNFINEITMLDDVLSIATVVCPCITTINVINVTKLAHLREISRFSNLQEVKIVCDLMNEEEKLEADEFLTVSGKKLKSLDLENFKMSIPVLMNNCQKLEILRLANIQYLPFDEKNNLGLPLKNLENLTIWGVEFDSEVAENSAIELLHCSPNVEKLSFTSCTFEVGQNLFSAVEAYCEKTTRLRVLDISHSTVDEALLHHVVLTCTPLEKLVVDFCEYVDSYQIERLRDVVKNCNSGIENVVKNCNSGIEIEFTSKSDLDSNEDDDFDGDLTDSWEDYEEDLEEDWEEDYYDEDDGDYYEYNLGFQI